MQGMPAFQPGGSVYLACLDGSQDADICYLSL